MARHSKRKATRRPKGAGSEWFEKSTGHWRWRITQGGQTYYASDIDRDRAQEKYDRLVEQLKHQIRVSDARMTLTDLAAQWFEAVRRDIGPTTYADYEKRYRLFIAAPLGHRRLCDLDARTIRRWLAATRDNYAFNSAKQARALLERILDLAVEDKLLEENPARLVKPPKPPRQPDADDEEGQHALTAAQVEQLLTEARRVDKLWTTSKAARGEGLYVLYVLAVRTGLRRGELLGLRWQDIDLDARLLRVRQQVRSTATGYEVSATLKTKAARRTVPLIDDIIQLLREYKLRMGPRGHGLLFPDKTGEARNPNTITRNFARIVARLGLGDYHLHDLRHTWVTLMRQAGVDLEVLGGLAGHEHTDTTANTYSAISLERSRAAMEKLG